MLGSKEKKNKIQNQNKTKQKLPTVCTRTGLAFEGAEKDVKGHTYLEVTGI